VNARAFWLRLCRRLHIVWLRTRLAQLLNQVQALGLSTGPEASQLLGDLLVQVTDLRLRLGDLEREARIEHRVRTLLRRMP
jgi:hypothetical protein